MRNIILITIASLVVFASCEQKQKAPEAPKKFALSDTMKKMIQLDTVQTSNMVTELSLSGVISYNDNNVVKIYPRSSGQVVETKVSLGDKVVAGQVLAIMKSADVAGNYADLSSANADVQIAKRQMDNQESLYKNGISSEREFNEAKQNYDKALAAQEKAKSIITINGGGKTSSGGQYLITSPISGYIVEKKVTAGAFIRSDMGDQLFTISDLKDVWVYANVYEADIAKIKEGDEVKVLPLSYPDKVFAGKVDKMSQVLDPQSKALKVRINLSNSDMLLKPDMFAKVIVTNQNGTDALCIPTSAVISQDGKKYVVLYNSPDDMKVVEVSLIKTVADKTYIASGLTSGQLLITKNQLLIFNQLTTVEAK